MRSVCEVVLSLKCDDSAIHIVLIRAITCLNRGFPPEKVLDIMMREGFSKLKRRFGRAILTRWEGRHLPRALILRGP
jgi:hypothetical protein